MTERTKLASVESEDYTSLAVTPTELMAPTLVGQSSMGLPTGQEGTDTRHEFTKSKFNVEKEKVTTLGYNDDDGEPLILSLQDPTGHKVGSIVV